MLTFTPKSSHVNSCESHFPCVVVLYMAISNQLSLLWHLPHIINSTQPITTRMSFRHHNAAFSPLPIKLYFLLSAFSTSSPVQGCSEPKTIGWGEQHWGGKRNFTETSTSCSVAKAVEVGGRGGRGM